MKKSTKKANPQVSWGLESWKGTQRAVTTSPFDSRAHDYLSISMYDTPIKLLEIGATFNGGRPRPALLEDGSQWLYANPNNKLQVVADTSLAIERFIGMDTPTHGEIINAYFSNKNLVAIAGNMSEPWYPQTRTAVMEMMDRYDREGLVKALCLELKGYSTQVGFEGRSSPLVVLKRTLNAPSPHGRGLHESHREMVAGLFGTNNYEDNY